MALSSKPQKETVDKIIDLLNSGRELILYDLETTGLSSMTSKIISCSAVKYRYDRGRLIEVDRLDQFINPGIPIPESSSRVNGITDDMVADKPDEWTAFEDVIKPFFGDNPIIGGYNIINFDNKFMKNLWLRSSGEELSPEAVIDVFLIVKEKMDLKNSTLENAAKELGADLGIGFHNSLDDVIVTQRVLELLIPLYYDAKEPAKFRFIVTGHYYQKYSHQSERVYVYTHPKSSSYYDFYKKKWYTDATEDFDMSDLRADFLTYMKVHNESELEKLLRASS